MSVIMDSTIDPYTLSILITEIFYLRDKVANIREEVVNTKQEIVDIKNSITMVNSNLENILKVLNEKTLKEQADCSECKKRKLQ